MHYSSRRVLTRSPDSRRNGVHPEFGAAVPQEEWWRLMRRSDQRLCERNRDVCRGIERQGAKQIIIRVSSMCSNSGNVYAEENAFEDILYFMKSNRVEMELDEFGWMFLIAASIREIDYYRRSCYKDNTYWKMRKDYAWIDRFGKVYDPFLTSMSWEFMISAMSSKFLSFFIFIKRNYYQIKISRLVCTHLTVNSHWTQSIYPLALNCLKKNCVHTI